MYEPKPGDLVTWEPFPVESRVVRARDTSLAEARWEVADQHGGIGVAVERRLSPLRPTAPGQRVRVGARIGRAEEFAEWRGPCGAWLVGPDDGGGNGLRQYEDVRECVRIAEPLLSTADITAAVSTAVAAGSAGFLARADRDSERTFDALVAPLLGPTGPVATLPDAITGYVPHTVIADDPWAPYRFPAGSVKWAPYEVKPKALMPLAPGYVYKLVDPGPAEPTPSPIAARHAGRCPSCARATREPGEARTVWWLCGCPVEVEGSECERLPDGSERNVLVWGGGTFGDGWTREEAMADWREDLALIQSDPTLRRHDADGYAWVRGEWRREIDERKRAAEKARRHETAAKIVSEVSDVVGKLGARTSTLNWHADDLVESLTGLGASLRKLSKKGGGK